MARCMACVFNRFGNIPRDFTRICTPYLILLDAASLKIETNKKPSSYT